MIYYLIIEQSISHWVPRLINTARTNYSSAWSKWKSTVNIDSRDKGKSAWSIDSRLERTSASTIDNPIKITMSLQAVVKLGATFVKTKRFTYSKDMIWTLSPYDDLQVTQNIENTDNGNIESEANENIADLLHVDLVSHAALSENRTVILGTCSTPITNETFRLAHVSRYGCPPLTKPHIR